MIENASDPNVVATGNPLFNLQNYFDPAPVGIDTRAAWAKGADGTGTTFIDLENGWFLDHVDLPAGIPLLWGDKQPSKLLSWRICVGYDGGPGQQYRDSGGCAEGAAGTGNLLLHHGDRRCYHRASQSKPDLNFGSRIDCYAWGDYVVTCYYDPATPRS